MSAVMMDLSSPPWFDQDPPILSDEQIGVNFQIDSPSRETDPFDILDDVHPAHTAPYDDSTVRKSAETTFDIIFKSPHLFISSIDISGFQRFAEPFRGLFEGMSEAKISKSSLFLLHYFAHLQRSLPFLELQKIINDPLQQDLPFLPPPPTLAMHFPATQPTDDSLVPTSAAPWQLFGGMKISDTNSHHADASTHTPQITKINGLGCFPAFGDNYDDVSNEEDESDDSDERASNAEIMIRTELENASEALLTDDSDDVEDSDSDTDYLPVRVSKPSPRTAIKTSESKLESKARYTGKAKTKKLSKPSRPSSRRRDHKLAKVLEASRVPNQTAKQEETDSEEDNRNRPYPCPNEGCKHSSLCPAELRKHELTHGDKQWFCQGCVKWFIRDDSLKRHFNTTSNARCIAYSHSKAWGPGMKNFKIGA